MPRYLGPTKGHFLPPLRTCRELACHQQAEHGRGGYCVWHDPRATEEERRAADLALEPPHIRRRMSRWGRAA